MAPENSNMKVKLAATLRQNGGAIHFIGIGGAGMSGIAKIFLTRGFTVSGSDAKSSSVTKSLSALGAKIFEGHSGENVGSAQVVVASTAISPQNPELLVAASQGILIITRAQALAYLMNGRRGVAVAGTHGKTTTTSMLTVALQSAGIDPSFAIGGILTSSGVNAFDGSGDVFVVEADESDGSFIEYQPKHAVITNLELDHVDHFATLEELETAFLKFVETIELGGSLTVCGDDAGIASLLPRITRQDLKIVKYGFGENNELVLSRAHFDQLGSSARVTLNGVVLGELSLKVAGEHNLLDAAAAFGAGMAIGADSRDLLAGLAGFSGSRRRFEIKGEVNSIVVVDDYGHHPTEIAATLKMARQYRPNAKLHVIFQPHRFSRTKAFAEQFALALSGADHYLLLEIYPASEAPIAGVTSHLIQKFATAGKGEVEPSLIDAARKVVAAATPGDLIMTLGAGDVTALSGVILEELREAHPNS